MKDALQQELIRSLAAQGAIASREVFAHCVQRWLAERIRAFAPVQREELRLSWYATLDLAAYPVPHADFDPSEELRALERVAFRDRRGLATAVTSLLWRSITSDSCVQCPACDSALLCYLWHEGTEAFLLSCPRCGWEQHLDGKRWISPDGRPAIVPTTQMLQTVWDSPRR